jgi:hypothetical protein
MGGGRPSRLRGKQIAGQFSEVAREGGTEAEGGRQGGGEADQGRSRGKALKSRGGRLAAEGAVRRRIKGGVGGKALESEGAACRLEVGRGGGSRAESWGGKALEGAPAVWRPLGGPWETRGA